MNTERPRFNDGEPLWYYGFRQRSPKIVKMVHDEGQVFIPVVLPAVVITLQNGDVAILESTKEVHYDDLYRYPADRAKLVDMMRYDARCLVRSADSIEAQSNPDESTVLIETQTSVVSDVDDFAADAASEVCALCHGTGSVKANKLYFSGNEVVMACTCEAGQQFKTKMNEAADMEMETADSIAVDNERRYVHSN